MRIEYVRTISGPNVISHSPILVMRLDLQDLTGKESQELPGFIDRLLATLPGVRQRLQDRASFGHVVEHVCLELTGRAGIPVNRGKTLDAGAKNLYDICVEYRSEGGMRRLLEVGVEFVQSLVDGRGYPLDERIAQVTDLTREYELGPSAKAIVDAAERRGIPCTRLGDDGLTQLGYGKHRKFVQAAMSSQTSAIAAHTAGDKALAKVLLTRAGVPTPKGRVVQSEDEAAHVFEEMGAPLVVKPLDANQGKGVSLDLWTAEQVRYAFDIARQVSRRVIVEELLHGRDYRVLVVNGRMLAACERIPASVVGDGKRTVQELVDEANRDPRRGDGHSEAMRMIKIDRAGVATLGKQGYRTESVPSEGARVLLRENANLSSGGSAIDITDDVHPSMQMICERTARAVGLDICGVDLVAPDITQPFTRGGVVEVNAAPEIAMHHFPSEGKPRDVASEIVKMLYPEGDGRIPIVSVTGTNGKTTVTRLISHILSARDVRVGMTTTDGIWVAGQQISTGDATGPRSAATVLFDPQVDLAVFETAQGGILRDGLGYDWSDIGVMTNIDEVLRFEALVAERVREGGTLVLNADDLTLRDVPQQRKVSCVPKNIVWFAFDALNPVLEAARHSGGTVYFVEENYILEACGSNRRRIMDARLIPLTLGGVARFQMANVMAAVAACRALGTGVARIRAALRSFDSRATLYAIDGRHVLLDFGRNSAAFDAIHDMAARWPAGDRICVLGMPGDRADDIIRNVGEAAARGFDRIIVRENVELGGRRPGEVPALLQEGIRREKAKAEILVVPNEIEALRQAIDRLQPSGLAVIFCENWSGVRAELHARGGVAVTSVDMEREKASFA